MAGCKKTTQELPYDRTGDEVQSINDCMWHEGMVQGLCIVDGATWAAMAGPSRQAWLSMHDVAGAAGDASLDRSSMAHARTCHSGSLLARFVSQYVPPSLQAATLGLNYVMQGHRLRNLLFILVSTSSRPLMNKWAKDYLLRCRCPYACWQRSCYLSQALQCLPQQCLALRANRLAPLPTVAHMPDDGAKACRHLGVPLGSWLFPSKSPGVTHTAYLQP